jgi:hypothetical protein
MSAPACAEVSNGGSTGIRYFLEQCHKTWMTMDQRLAWFYVIHQVLADIDNTFFLYFSSGICSTAL